MATKNNNPDVSAIRAALSAGVRPELKTRRVQLLLRPSVWEAVKREAAAVEMSANAWVEKLLELVAAEK